MACLRLFCGLLSVSVRVVDGVMQRWDGSGAVVMCFWSRRSDITAEIGRAQWWGNGWYSIFALL